MSLQHPPDRSLRAPWITEDLFEAIFEHTREAMLITSPDGGIHAANTAACRLFGMTEAELRASGRPGLVDPADGRLTPLLAQRRQAGTASGFLTFRRSDGSTFEGDVSSSVFRDGDGRELTVLLVRDVTARTAAEEALRRRERFEQALIDALPAHVAVLDATGTIAAVNEPWRRFARENGAAASTEVGVGIAYLEPCERAAACGDPSAGETVALLREVLAGARESGALEYPCHSPAADRWFMMRALRVPALGGVLVVHIDITDRRRAEEALRRSEALFRLTFDQSPYGAALVSLDYHFLRANARLCEMTGYTEEELQRLRFVDITHPDDVAADVEQAARLARGEIADYAVEKRYVRKTGESIWVRLSGRVLNDADGRPVVFLALVEDITAERRARASLASLAAIVDSSTDAIIGKSVDGTILSWNPAAERLYGYAADEAIGRHVSMLVPADRAEELDTLMRRVACGDRVEHVDTVRRTKDGRLVDVALTVSAVLDPTGAIVGLSAIAHDISGHKRAEQERESLIAQLQTALDEVKTLTGLLPICAHCKKIKDEQGLWNQLEAYIQQRSDAQFSHGICPECLRTHYPELPSGR